MRLIVVGVIVLALTGRQGKRRLMIFRKLKSIKQGLNLADYYVTKSPVGLPAHWDGEKLIDDKGGTYQRPIGLLNIFRPTLWTVC